MDILKIKRNKQGDIVDTWRWMARYMRRFAGGMIFYLGVGLINVGMGLAFSVLQKTLINAVTAEEKIPAEIIRAAAGVMAMALGQIATGAVSQWISVRINIRVVNEVRSEIFSRMLSAEWASISAFRSGDLINRLEGDVNTVAGGAVGLLPTAVTRLAQFGGAFGIILYYDPLMAAVSLISAPVLLISGRPLVRLLRRHNERMREVNGRILSFASESFRELPTVKAFGLGGEFCRALGHLLGDYRDVRLSHSRVSIAMSVVMGILGLAAGYGCYGLGVWRLYIGAIDYGEMMLFLSLSGTLSSSFSALIRVVPQAVSVGTAARRVMEVTELPAESDADAEAAMRLRTVAERNGVRICACNLRFGYGDERDVLDDVNVCMEPGDTVALVGESGGGKSTFLRLLLALFEPTAGQLFLEAGDGTHRLPVSASTRCLCTYVPQGGGFFGKSVREGLSMVAPGASDEALWHALWIADAADFVRALPEGLDTPLGEGGGNLSEGQRQRLAIARAVLRDAPILILDEATSALDAETEARVLARLMAGHGQGICLFTTHRPAMLAYAGRILRVESGRIVETENHRIS